MGVVTSLLSPSDVTLVQMQGSTRSDELLEPFIGFLNEGNGGHRRVVVDATPTVEFDFTYTEIQRFLPYLKVALAKPNCSFHYRVAVGKGATLAACRVFQMLTKNDPRVQLDTHETLDEALSAFGLTPMHVDAATAHAS